MTSLQSLKDTWPSSFVSRENVEKFTGGLMKGRYLANLDSLRLGPPRIRVGRKVGYPVDELILWLEKRIQG